MRSVAEQLADEIVDAGGLLRFDRYLEIALYGEAGFYTATGHAGRRGDFLTSPEVGPLFGVVVARWLDAEWERQGHPARFRFIDLGAGPGTLARSVLAAHPRCEAALDYVAVERSAAQRSRHPAGVDSRERLPDDAVAGVVFANELVDNLPFRLVVFDGSWREAYIALQGDRPVEVLQHFEPRPDIHLPAQAPHGARAPLHDDARALLERARTCVAGGRVALIDYAVATTHHLALRSWREWLRTYRQHERGGHYLVGAGQQDITTEVALDQLVATLGPVTELRSQAQWLQRWGIDELVDEGRRQWQERSGVADLAAMTFRSRITEAEALLDPQGLGAFTVAEWVHHDEY